MEPSVDPADDNAGDRVDVADGDPSIVFASLFERHGPAVLRYLTRRVGSGPAEDLLAETFLRALSNRRSYAPGKAGPGPWLFGIATNVLREHLRERGRDLATGAVDQGGLWVDGPAETVPDRVDAQRRTSRLAAGIAALDPGDRDVLLLTAWAGLSTGEVAAALGIPAGTVRSRLHRVRQRLRRGEVGMTPAVADPERSGSDAVI